jgi:hypothetical protein
MEVLPAEKGLWKAAVEVSRSVYERDRKEVCRHAWSE